MDSKIRAALRSYASKQDFLATIGKDGLNDNLIASLNDALEARELIKVNVLQAAAKTAKELAEELTVKTRSEVITVIGNKIVLYRKTHRKDVVHLLEKLRQIEKNAKIEKEEESNKKRNR